MLRLDAETRGFKITNFLIIKMVDANGLEPPTPCV